MSNLTIKDGTGAGFVAKVDSKNRLRTITVSEAESKVHASEGNAYSFSINNLPILANVPTPVWWISFDDPVRKFYLNTFYASWNGGAVSQNKTMEAALYTGMSVPTANFTQGKMGNLNFTSTNVALATAYYWNGVGNGMTVAANGLLLQAQKFAPGLTVIPINGTMILGKGNSLATVITAPEAGSYTGVVSGWFE